MKENKTKFVILGMLHHEPMTGYDIKKRLETTISHFWGLGFGQIYPMLKRLEEGKLVTMAVDSFAKGPARKVYSITPNGVRDLRSWLELPVEQESAKYEIMLKLFFGSQLTKAQTSAMIETFGKRYQQMLPIFDQFENNLKGILDQSPEHVHYLLTVLFGKKVYGAYVEWAEEAMGILAKYRKD